MPKHIQRLIILFVVFGALAVTARNYFKDKSFYEFGHYRGDSVVEIARDKPKYKGTAYCQSCHAAQFAEWSKGVHNSPEIGKIVKCEVCHGPGGGRDAEAGYIHAATGPDHPKDLKLIVPTDTRKLCPLCHEKLEARPAAQLQIVIDEHAGTQQCTLCHNPHSPKTLVGAIAPLLHPGNPATGKSKAAACLGCHGAVGISQGLPGPTLAAQNPAYLAEKLGEYKAGKRNNPMMSPMAAGLSPGDMEDLGAYFSGLKCEVAPDALNQAGAGIRAKAAICANCHGTNGVATSRSWPNLAGQSKDFLVNALKAYKAGERTNIVMSPLAKDLSDADMENLAAHYANAVCK